MTGKTKSNPNRLSSLRRGEMELVQDVARLVLGMAARLQANHARHAAKLDLTPGQAKVLMTLQPGEAIPMRTLADRMTTDPSNLTGLVDKLEERGALVREPHRSDRRIKALALTANGEQLRGAFFGLLTGDAGPLAHLSVAELTALRDLLSPTLAEPAGGSARRVGPRAVGGSPGR
ncbi:MAG: MarR family transcriptional regulator [Pseudonocardia sp.]|nr:MarR family transcriptional regulator [Pseudonocardia sp.]MBO0892578.1 MarR family transcriptional regulator [Acidothermales bacterium]